MAAPVAKAGVRCSPMKLALGNSTVRARDKDRQQFHALQQANTDNVLRVSVSNFGGEMVEFELDSGSKVADVKAKVAQIWQVPVMCQKLMINSVLVHDSELLFEHRRTDGSLTVSLLISMDRASKDLADKHGSGKQIQALAALLKLGARGGDGLVSLVCSGLEHQHLLVRRKAAEVLGKVCGKGDKRAIKEVSLRLEHADESIRATAVEALTRVADRGDDLAVSTLCKLLVHRDSGVRRTAVQASVELAERGDVRIIEALTPHIVDPEESQRKAAVEALLQLADKGDARVVEAATSHLSQQDAPVRCSALQLLPIVAEEGNLLAMSAVYACLQDKDVAVRLAAIQTLCVIARRADETAVCAIRDRLRDEHVDVRLAAVRSLVKLAGKGDAGSILALRACTNDMDDAVKIAGIQVLSKVAEKSDAVAIDAITSCLTSDNFALRLAAVQALPKVADKGMQNVITATKERLEDDHPSVRVAALHALAKLAEKGDNSVIDVVTRCFKDPDDGVQAAAAHTLTRVAESSRARSIVAMTAHANRMGVYPRLRAPDDRRRLGQTESDGRSRLMRGLRGMTGAISKPAPVASNQCIQPKAIQKCTDTAVASGADSSSQQILEDEPDLESVPEPLHYTSKTLLRSIGGAWTSNHYRAPVRHPEGRECAPPSEATVIPKQLHSQNSNPNLKAPTSPLSPVAKRGRFVRSTSFQTSATQKEPMRTHLNSAGRRREKHVA